LEVLLDTTESLLTCGEAAKLLDRSPESVRSYEREGKLPAFKTARGFRLFREADVVEFRRKRDRKSEDAAA